MVLSFRPIQPSDAATLCDINYWSYAKGRKANEAFDQLSYYRLLDLKVNVINSAFAPGMAFKVPDTRYKGLIATDENGLDVGDIIWCEWHDDEETLNTDIVEIFQLPEHAYTGKNLLKEFLKNLTPEQEIIGMQVIPENIAPYKRLGFEICASENDARSAEYMMMKTTQSRLQTLVNRSDI